MPTDETKYTAIGAIIAGGFGLLAKIAVWSMGTWRSRHQEAERKIHDDRENAVSERALAYAALKDRISDLNAELKEERHRADVATAQNDALRQENWALRSENIQLRERLDT